MSESPFDRAVGSQFVTTATSADTIDDVTPRWVVRPGSPDEAAAVVSIACDRNLTLVPRGLGRHLRIGNPPRRADVILSTERLDRILTHEPADMTVRVQAGCSIPKLGATLYESRQWLPLDPCGAPETSVGGLLAANLSGPLRASQGTARDLLIGIRTVMPDGALVSGGGQVVKNVAGYDLPKMHIGALGTLGLIVEATFKVRPRPASEKALSIPCASASDAAGIALEMRDACEPLWLQIVSEADATNPWAIIVGAGGRPEEVEAALASHHAVARAHGATVFAVENATELRHHIADTVGDDSRLALRAATLPTQVGACLMSIRSAAERGGAAVALQADVVSGVIRAAVDWPTNPAGLVGELRPALERTGGGLVVERASAARKRELSEVGGVWGEPGSDSALMRGLKEAFDPTGRFAPGRFVGGL